METERAAPPGLPAMRKADVVADDLLGGIVSGRIAVGSTLATEDQLAAAYSVNRSVVREAIKLLEVHGLVRPVRRRGTRVLDPMASISPKVLQCMLQPAGGRIDRRVLGSLLEIRAVLDVEMCALAAQRRTRVDLVALNAAVNALAAHVGNAHAYTAAMGRFAAAVARATHSVLFEMLAAWNQQVVAQLEPVVAVTRPATQEHQQGVTLLLQLIAQQDADTVRQLVSGFHAWATPRVLAACALANGEDLNDSMETYQ